jgi:hypothetical protein
MHIDPQDSRIFQECPVLPGIEENVAASSSDQESQAMLVPESGMSGIVFNERY